MFGIQKKSLQGKEKSIQTAIEMDGQKEIGFNIWFIIDQATQACHYYIIKPYCISGSEQKKLETLNELAKYDFVTSPRKKIPENYVITIGNEEYPGCIPAYAVEDFFVNNFNYFATEVEKMLPPVFKFDFVTGNHQALPQKLLDAPLFVRTFVLEDDYGNLTPKFSDKKKDVYR